MSYFDIKLKNCDDGTFTLNIPYQPNDEQFFVSAIMDRLGVMLMMDEKGLQKIKKALEAI